MWGVPEFTTIADSLPVSWPVLVMMLVAAGLAGWIDAVVGGGGLIQLPAVVLGLPSSLPTGSVLGVNKMASFAGTFASANVYLRRVRVRAATLVPVVLGAYSGSTMGALISRTIPRAVFTPIVLVAVVFVATTVWRRKQLGLEHHPRFSGWAAVWRCLVIGLVVGCYDGIIGPGAGSFFVLGFVAVLGYGFLQASVHAKLANLVTNLASLVVYGLHGELLVAMGLVMAAANLAGGLVGARMAIRHGNAFVRRVFLVVMVIMVTWLAIETARSLV